MNDLQPLLALLAQTETERDAAQLRFQRAQAAAGTAQAQAEQLLGYRRDYELRWGAEFSRDGKIELVRCYQGFIERLSQAVDQQTLLAERTAQQLALCRTELAQHELRVASVRKLIERRQQQVRIDGDRREQKASDEFATRAAWNRLAAGRAHVA
jgi:flagellar FliJ protein